MSEKEIARWEKTRSSGKMYFILRTALIFFWVMISVFILSDWFSGNPIKIEPFFLGLVAVMGLLLGVVSWWFADARYQTYFLDKKIQDGKNLPK